MKRPRLLLVLTGSSFLLSCVIAVAIASAALSLVGPEFRPDAAILGRGNTCDAGGGRVAVADLRVDTGDLFVSWKDSNDAVVAGPVLVAGSTGYPLRWSCAKDGRVLLLFAGRYRVMSPEGPLGPERTLCPQGNCDSWSPAASAAVGQGWFAGWLSPTGSLNARFLASDGSPDGEAMLLHDAATGGAITSWSVAGDGDGRAVVAWQQGAYGQPDLRALLVGPGGAESEELELNEYRSGDAGRLEVQREARRRVVVTWQNSWQGGPVARRLSSDDVAPATTTTTTTLDPRVPEFLPAVDLAVDASEEAHTWTGLSLSLDAAGRWLAQWSERFAMSATSSDEGRHWSDGDEVGSDASEAAAAGDDAGNQVQAWEANGSIRYRHSADAGATWSEVRDLYANGFGATWFRLSGLEIAAGGNHRWVAAWMETEQAGYTDDHDSDHRENLLCGLRVAVSADDGRSWGAARTLHPVSCWFGASLSLAGDRHGNWLLAWIDEGIELAHSNDDGRTWVVDGDARFAQARQAPQVVDVASDGSGRWLAAWDRIVQRGDDRVFDVHRVFVASSDDAGLHWSDAQGLVPWTAAATGSDMAPSLAFRDGRWGIAWQSFSGADGNGLDADILASFSTDGAQTWSFPSVVDRAARSDERYDEAPELAATASDAWALLWSSREREGAHVRFVRSRGSCGNGVREGSEECDDGNAVDGDGCDVNCLATACGNGIVTAGEACDDGNLDESDHCLDDCSAASCGDGRTEDGIEDCDDGNADESDACLGSCRFNVCGDGEPLAGIEECDDGVSNVVYGHCLPDCRVARCGDGWIHEGKEECDDGNLEKGDRCDKQCRIDAFCESVPSAGQTTATQALTVLKKAVGMRVRCPRARCDADADGRVTAIDALTTLRRAVGALQEETCAQRSLVVRLVSADRTPGALQVLLDYRNASGDLVVDRGEIDCTVAALPGTFSASHGDAGRGIFAAGWISLSEIRTPAELLRCRWQGLVSAGTTGMVLSVPDASDRSGDPVQVQLQLSIE